jgi:single-strand DNA-binding protein
MASFAKVALVGNLGADPETKYTPNGTMVVELRIAVNPRQRNQQGQGQEDAKPTWYRVSAWDRLADRIDRMTQQGYLAKGRQLYVEGRLEPREFTGNDGQVRVSFDVTMTDFQFVGERRDSQSGDDAAGGGYGSTGGSSGGGNYRNTDNTGSAEGSSNRRQNFNDSPPNDMDDIPF